MGLLNSYIECMKAGDASGMKSLFTEDAEFIDDAPISMGMEPIHIRGRDNIEVFLRNVFEGGGLDVSNVAMNGNAMRYDLKFGSRVLQCIGVVKEENGLIQEYRVVAV
ncbi:nuclear transport factor 2 family protein [Chloroflexota bacterium]